MLVAIHQPQYFPWPRYVHKILAADIFVYLDTVQFSKNGLQNRNQIKTLAGASWLTLPVRHHFGQNLNEVEIADARATNKHWKTIQANYARTPGFALWTTELEELLTVEYRSLADATVASTEWMLEKLNTKSKRIKASGLSNITGSASQLVASICREVGATKYLTGTGAMAYLDQKDFEEFGCEIAVQTWDNFDYEQAHPSAGFIPDLSTLDLLLNCPTSAHEMIMNAGNWKAFAK